jgi:acyl carrier protein
MTQMNEVMEERVRGVLSKVARFPSSDEAFPPDADLFRELCIDSGAALDMLLSLEDEFGVAIPDGTFGNARTLRAIATLIAELEELRNK